MTVILYNSFLGVITSLSKILEVSTEPERSLTVIHSLGSCNILYLLIKKKNDFSTTKCIDILVSNYYKYIVSMWL